MTIHNPPHPEELPLSPVTTGTPQPYQDEVRDDIQEILEDPSRGDEDAVKGEDDSAKTDVEQKKFWTREEALARINHFDFSHRFHQVAPSDREVVLNAIDATTAKQIIAFSLEQLPIAERTTVALQIIEKWGEEVALSVLHHIEHTPTSEHKEIFLHIIEKSNIEFINSLSFTHSFLEAFQHEWKDILLRLLDMASPYALQSIAYHVLPKLPPSDRKEIALLMIRKGNPEITDTIRYNVKQIPEYDRKSVVLALSEKADQFLSWSFLTDLLSLLPASDRKEAALYFLEKWKTEIIFYLAEDRLLIEIPESERKDVVLGILKYSTLEHVTFYHYHLNILPLIDRKEIVLRVLEKWGEKAAISVLFETESLPEEDRKPVLLNILGYSSQEELGFFYFRLNLLPPTDRKEVLLQILEKWGGEATESILMEMSSIPEEDKKTVIMWILMALDITAASELISSWPYRDNLNSIDLYEVALSVIEAGHSDLIQQVLEDFPKSMQPQIKTKLAQANQGISVAWPGH